MPELLVLAFFLFFLYKYARIISSGVFFYFFYINMPELFVLAFFFIFFNFFYINMPELLVLVFFFNLFYINMPELLVLAFFLFFLYKYAGTISSGIFLINCILKNVFAMFLL
jgi:hypothetical protein